ncbi:hypothetical protein Nit79A3_1389 [Nitrosomonas sp. Is79A3]|uniref:hypothetical protein n=1 Tax=Nitrosomonas sp. (strain Is79A3) TaxID=261292 RepID=UPI000215CEF8
MIKIIQLIVYNGALLALCDDSKILEYDERSGTWLTFSSINSKLLEELAKKEARDE